MRECSRCRQWWPGPLCEVEGRQVCDGCLTMYDDNPPEYWIAMPDCLRRQYDLN